MTDSDSGPQASPFASPQTSDEPAAADCPRCGEPMEQGYLASDSTIRWQAADIGTLKKWITGGKQLAATKSGFGYRIAAFYCEGCGLLQVRS